MFGISLPLASLFGLHLGWGLPGLWIGYGVSAFFLGVVYSVILFKYIDWDKTAHLASQSETEDSMYS
jgi:Na+-driven multidrug efflux pump